VRCSSPMRAFLETNYGPLFKLYALSFWLKKLSFWCSSFSQAILDPEEVNVSLKKTFLSFPSCAVWSLGIVGGGSAGGEKPRWFYLWSAPVQSAVSWYQQVCSSLLKTGRQPLASWQPFTPLNIRKEELSLFVFLFSTIWEQEETLPKEN
jgi:hypothetical protein